MAILWSTTGDTKAKVYLLGAYPQYGAHESAGLILSKEVNRLARELHECRRQARMDVGSLAMTLSDHLDRSRGQSRPKKGHCG